MYIHIGKETMITLDNIVVVLNLEKMLEKNKFNDIIKTLKLEDNIIDISEGNLKSLIIVEESNNFIGYITNISSITIGKRINKKII